MYTSFRLALAGSDARAVLLGTLGLLVVFSAPTHRVDLLAFGLVAATAACVWRIRAALFLIGAGLPFYFFPRAIVGSVGVTPPSLVLALAALSALIRATAARRSGSPSGLSLGATGYDGPLALFLFGSLLSLLPSQYLLLSVREVRALIVEPLLFFFLVTILRRTGAVSSALAGFLCVAAALAAIAVVQVLFGFGGTAAEGVRRAQAWYPSPNHLGLTLGRALPFLIALVAVPRPGTTARLVAIPASFIVGLAILLTFSLGAWLGTTLGIIVVLVTTARQRLALWIAAGAALVFLGTSFLAFSGRLPERLNPARQTTGFRIELWQSSLQMVKDHPLLGVGPDNFVYLYQQIYLQEGAAAEPNLSHPHNWLLHVWLEVGLAGLIGFLCLLWRFGANIRLAAHRAGPGIWIVGGAAGSMADTLVHGLIDNSYFLVDLAFVFWLTLALVQHETRGQEDSGASPQSLE